MVGFALAGNGSSEKIAWDPIIRHCWGKTTVCETSAITFLYQLPDLGMGAVIAQQAVYQLCRQTVQVGLQVLYSLIQALFYPHGLHSGIQ